MTEGTATISAIKRTVPSIDALLDGYSAQEVENTSKVKVAEEGYDYNPLLAKLEENLNQTDSNKYDSDEHITDVLTPKQINIFLKLTVTLEERPRYVITTGYFITKLIQNSYTAGHNNFTLNLENLPEMDFIGFHFRGKKKNPLAITITGKAGDYCGYGAEHCTFNLQETGNECANRAENCTFNAEKTGDQYGSGAKNSTVNTKITGTHCGWAAFNCTFSAQKTGEKYGFGAKNCSLSTAKTGDECGVVAKNSTFKTANQKTLKKMLADVPEGNRVIFIDAEGNEEVKRDCQ